MDRRRGSRKAGHTGGGMSSEERQRGKIASSSSSQATLPSVSPSSIAGDFEKKLELSVTSVSGAGPSSYSKSLTPPARPGFGRLGTKCMIKANHFLVQVSSKELFHYDVAITPEVTSKGVNRSIIRELVRKHRDTHLGKRTPVYDGKKSLYTAGPLPFISEEFAVALDDGDKGSVQPRRTRTFKVAIKLVAQHNLHNLQQFLSGKQFDVPQDVIQILDIVLRESPSINYSCIGRSFFSRQLGPAKELPDGLECWRGFYQSIRLTQMGLTLNLDFSATSFYEPLVVTEFVMKHLNLRDLSNRFNEHARIKVKKALKGVKVLTIHRKDLHRQYRISGITNLSATQLTFDENGTMVSVAQYFRERYKFPLRYPNLPCLQVGSDKKPTYLPMEACQIVDGQRYSMKLNDRQVKAILKEACQRPREREQHIRQMVQQNKYHGDKYALEFGINVKEQLTSIEARVLPPPMLKYHETGRESKCLPRIGQWNMINKKMVGGGTIHYWACVNFSRTPHNLCEQFCHSLSEMCGNIGMNYQRNPLFPIISSPGNKIETALHKVYEDSVSLLNKRDKGKQLQLLIVILPDISGEYGKIKRICETELGIVSQCCQPRNITRPNNQYLENVALKINVKVGGRNTVLVDAISRKIPLVTDKPTILFGADVTHPNPGEDSGPSIAAVVASMDWPEITKYRGLVSSQRHRQEIIDDLYTEVADAKSGIVRGGIIRDHLRAFYRANNRKPERIIFYRDGVSEGQFSQVLLYELNAIWKACASLEEGYLPPVTFVVVQKRHHTRLFPMDPKNTDKSGNILPGTVVDTNICHPIEFDFYLNSHAGIQGTSRPTHYHVLWDDNKFSADALQTFTNNLCYTYARCTRSVSIVPPAYYAHLAAFRARYYIEDNASDGSSSAGTSQSTRGGTAAIRSLPKIKDNVKEVMFFC